jgi:hypothetical protein
MRTPHSSYECYISKQKPKYGTTFIDWYYENNKISGAYILDEINKRSGESHMDYLKNYGYDESQNYYSYHRDFFMKKLQLCHNLIQVKSNECGLDYMSYGINTVADIMDIYEDIICEVCLGINVGVCSLPSGIYTNGSIYVTKDKTFNSLDELKTELSTGEVVVYYFMVNENHSIKVRMAKKELLTRKVFTERVNQIA